MTAMPFSVRPGGTLKIYSLKSSYLIVDNKCLINKIHRFKVIRHDLGKFNFGGQNEDKNIVSSKYYC